MMDKSKMNYLVDGLLGVSFLITALTGLLIFFFIPSGVPQGRYQVFLGISKGIWSAVHDWAGIAMIALSIIHVLLHWKWIVCMTKSFFNKKEENGGK